MRTRIRIGQPEEWNRTEEVEAGVEALRRDLFADLPPVSDALVERVIRAIEEEAATRSLVTLGDCLPLATCLVLALFIPVVAHVTAAAVAGLGVVGLVYAAFIRWLANWQPGAGPPRGAAFAAEG